MELKKVEETDAQAHAVEIGARWFEVSSSDTDGKVEVLLQKIVRDLLDRNVIKEDTQDTE